MKESDQIIRNFMDVKEALIQENLKRDSGFPTTRKYSGIIDRLIHTLFLAATPDPTRRRFLENHITLVPMGSYGRLELCMGSDVDLLFLYTGGLSTGISDLIPSILYPLWDAKLTVSHSVLRAQECVRLAMHDFRTLTSVLDGRFLLGSRSLYQRFKRLLWARVEKESKTLLEHFWVAKEKRERKYSQQGYFAEPDIKEGLGGIRDLHFMEWMAKLYFHCKRFGQIRRYEAFSHFDLNRLNHSKSFLLKVRNHLHVLANRKEDRLLISYQSDLAKSLGYRDGPHTSAAERFLRRLYMHMNRVRYGAEEFHAKALELLEPNHREPGPKESHPEFSVYKGNIELRSGRLFEKSPLVLLEGFREANRRGLFLGSGFIWEARKRVAEQGRGLLNVPGAKEVFLDLITQPQNPKVLRLALEIGLISIFIPEFKKIRNLALFSYYHEETVDLHALKTVEVIQDIAGGLYNERWPVLREVFEEVEHPEWLFLSALLHDIGKGYRGDHAKKGEDLIPRILVRLGIQGPAMEVVPFLIKNHLLLARVSQRRDLKDEKTAEQVAQTLQDLERLRLLFLLTVADTLCSGPSSNSDWKVILLDELYFKVRHILKGGILATSDAAGRLEEVKKQLTEELRPHFLKKDILTLIEQIPLSYFLNTGLEDILRHFRLALTMKKKKLAWILQKLEHAPVTRVVMRTFDKPGLFSKMVGVFTLNNIEVLSAKIYTLKNGLAFDVYEVTNPLDPYREAESWKKIQKEAIEAMEDRMPLDALIARKHSRPSPLKGVLGNVVRSVKVDNNASDFQTIIEVSAEDRIGLLYKLAKKIYSLGLNIRLARVDSDKLRMTGVFYVSDSRWQKLMDPPVIRNIKREILRGLS